MKLFCRFRKERPGIGRVSAPCGGGGASRMAQAVRRCAHERLRRLRIRRIRNRARRSEEHTSELQSPCNLVCRLLLEKKKKKLTKCMILRVDQRRLSPSER